MTRQYCAKLTVSRPCFVLQEHFCLSHRATFEPCHVKLLIYNWRELATRWQQLMPWNLVTRYRPTAYTMTSVHRNKIPRLISHHTMSTSRKLFLRIGRDWCGWLLSVLEVDEWRLRKVFGKIGIVLNVWILVAPVYAVQYIRNVR